MGWPIVPGFDFSGIVEKSYDSEYREGELVFGFTMFGAYTSRLLVPASQLRRLPVLRGGGQFPMEEAAGLPAVAGTALHAVRLYDLLSVTHKNDSFFIIEIR